MPVETVAMSALFASDTLGCGMSAYGGPILSNAAPGQWACSPAPFQPQQ